MGTAIIGLIGVVIGGVLTSLLSYWQERRRERMRLRTAARLMLERFENAIRAIELAREMATSPIEAPVLFEEDFEVPEWSETRALFADQLDTEAFSTLSKAVRQLDSHRLYAQRYRERRGDVGEFGFLRVEFLRMEAAQIRRHLTLLLLLANTDLSPWFVRRWHRWRDKPTLVHEATDIALSAEIERLRAAKAASADE